jgi:hypothetical protein
VAGDAPQFPMPRGSDAKSLYAWAAAFVAFLRRRDRAVETTITETVVEVLEPISEDRQVTLDAAAAYAAQVQAAITASGGIAQEVYDQYVDAAAATQANAAQFYLTQAANTVEAAVRVDENSVTSTNIDTVAAYLAGSAATITDIAEAVANGDTAIATQVSTVQTQANGNTAALINITESAGGTDINYGLIATENGTIKAAFNMQSGALGSNIVFLADRFGVSVPDDDGTVMTPFIVGEIAGVPTVGIDGALVVDGTIIADAIAADAITADKIEAGAVTADKIDVTSLDAITADVGTITAGVLQSSDGKMVIDLNSKSIVMTV